MYEHLLESSEFYQKRYHNFSSKIILPVFMLLVVIVVFLGFMNKEITLKSQATVEPVKVLAQVQSTSNNKIKINHLGENKLVKEGELLVEYTSDNEQIQYQTTKKQLELLQPQKQQLELLKQSFEKDVNQFSTEDNFGYSKRFDDYLSQKQTLIKNVDQQNKTIESQNVAAADAKNKIGTIMDEVSNKIADYQDVKTAISTNASVVNSNVAYSVYSNYKSKNVSSLTNEEKVALKEEFISQIDSQIQQFQTELSSYQVQYSSSGTQQEYNSSLDSQVASLKSQKISEVSQELTALNQKIEELQGGVILQEKTLKDSQLYSKVSGIIHVNEEVIDAVIIPEGTVIAQVYPIIEKEKRVRIETYIPSKDITTLKVGDEVKFKTQDSDNHEVALNSTISRIDSSATKTKSGSFFKVCAEVNLSDEQLKDLKYGMSGSMVVVTGKKTYLNYYLDKFLKL